MSTALESMPDLRFENPPVQQVTLSIFFAPLFEMPSVVLLSILSKWHADYSSVEEVAPDSLWRRPSESESETLRGDARATYWPPPMYVMSQDDGQKSIRVQHDRFEQVWRFTPQVEGSRYIGYEALRTELIERFDEFSEAVEEAIGKRPVPERLDATYQNLVDLPTRAFCIGVLSGWRCDELAVGYDSEYSGMRLTNLSDTGDVDTDTLVAIDPGPDGNGTDFLIDVQCMKTGESEYIDRLDLAHATVLQIFERLTSEDLRRGWGQL